MEPGGRRSDGYAGTNVAVLGASGFIGRWVARELCAREAIVYLVVRNQAAAQEVFAKYGVRGNTVERDVGQSGVVKKLFQEIRPSITFNLVGYGVDPSEREESVAYQINASLVERIGVAAAQLQDPAWQGQDVIHVGSAAEYGALDNDLREESVPTPTTLYGKTKLAGTRALVRCCQAHYVKGLTARLFTVYGPGEHPGRLLPMLFETARTGTPLALTAGRQKRDFAYVRDVAESLLRLGLIRARPGEIVNVATGQLTCVRRFAEVAAKVLEIPESRLKFGELSTRAGEMDHQPVNIERLQRLIAWSPSTKVAEGIRRTVEFGCGKRYGCDP